MVQHVEPLGLENLKFATHHFESANLP